MTNEKSISYLTKIVSDLNSIYYDERIEFSFEIFEKGYAHNLFVYLDKANDLNSKGIHHALFINIEGVSVDLIFSKELYKTMDLQKLKDISKEIIKKYEKQVTINYRNFLI